MIRRNFLRWPLGLAAAMMAALVSLSPARAQNFTDSLVILPHAAAHDDFNAVVAKVGAGDSVDTEDESGRTALSFAAANGDMRIADFLLQHGARIDLADNSGETPLHWAAFKGEAQMVARLVAAKATVDAQSHDGTTPLMLAVINGHLAAVRALIAAGADPTLEDFTGHDAIDMAQGKPAILALLKAGQRKRQ